MEHWMIKLFSNKFITKRKQKRFQKFTMKYFLFWKKKVTFCVFKSTKIAVFLVFSFFFLFCFPNQFRDYTFSVIRYKLIHFENFFRFLEILCKVLKCWCFKVSWKNYNKKDFRRRFWATNATCKIPMHVVLLWKSL